MKSQHSGTSAAAWSTLFVVCLVSMLIGLNSSTVNVALPALTRHFDATHFEASWLVLSYMVASTASLLLFGRISDMVNQRLLYLGGLGTYTLCSLACGFAPTVEWLIGLRILAALAGAVLLGNGATLIHSIFPKVSLGTAMGLYAASFPVASLIGPIAAGIVLEFTGWRWVFWLNVPIGVVALAVGFLLLRRDPERAEGISLDLTGNTLVIVVITLTTVSISMVSEFGWASPFVYGGLLISLTLLPLLALAERRSRHPVIDVATLRTHGIGLLLLAGFFLSAGRFPAIVLMSLYLQGPLDLRPVETAVLLLPMPIGSILGSLCVGWLSRRRHARQISMIGAVVGQVGMMALTGAVFAQHEWVLAGSLVFVGMGTGLFIGSNATSLLEATPDESLGVVNGMRLAVQNTGNVLSLALALTLLTVGLSPGLSEAVLQASIPGSQAPPQIIAGFGWSLTFLCVLGLVGTVVSITAASRRRAPTREVEVPAALSSVSETP
ncbi:MFS transporter [Aeromicrobium senzhongii]|uniref:MFS transporter n=1 Tax=Aeromicrobium senzhongii TaxID=2663859 RepID=A0ABX6SSE9_9ACTN|nr:MFS transporter [Aeromicrobium senzhongii]MTB89544.1 MFS transporter [Aeromicrobium senzhongii]QNL94328.1 MFS transporter [Aeromicrobium senzhongii]